MNLFLRLRHWQLFTLLFGIPIILHVVTMVSIITNPEQTSVFTLFPVIMIISMTTFFCWFYSLGTSLHKKLPDGVNMNINRFKLFLFLPIIYLLFFVGFMSTTIINLNEGKQPSPLIFAIIIPLHFFMMFCMFYLLYFTSKSLKAVELQREVTFNDYSGEFFLMWFYPIGIWFIQPRVNELFKDPATKQKGIDDTLT